MFGKGPISSAAISSLTGRRLLAALQEYLSAADQYDNYYNAVANQDESASALDQLSNFASQLALTQESSNALDSAESNYLVNVFISELQSLLDSGSANFITNQNVNEFLALIDQVISQLNAVTFINETSSLTEASNRTIVRPASIAELSSGLDVATVINYAVARIAEATQALDQYNVAPSIYNVQVVEPRLVTDQTSNNAFYVVASSINSRTQSNGLLIKAYVNDLAAVQLAPVTAGLTAYTVGADIEVLDDGKPIVIADPQYISADLTVGYFKMTAELVYRSIAVAA